MRLAFSELPALQFPKSFDDVDDDFFCPAALRKYAEVNGGPPERVLVYRDGVGDGQLEQVYNYEVRQMTEAFRDYQKGYQ